MSGAHFEWGIASSTRPGQSVSGDGYLVRAVPEGSLLAVVDGTGHGPEAARAAGLAVEVLSGSAAETLADRIQRCHLELAATRGVAMLVALFDASDSTLSWAGVGDAIGVLVRADALARPRVEILFPREGIVGVSIPRLTSSILALRDRDLLVLATDGVRDAFLEDTRPGDAPRVTAERILRHYGKGSDDALVLAVRFHVSPV